MTRKPACRITALFGLFLVLLVALLATSTAATAAMVDVDILSDGRGTLPTYRIVPRGHYSTHRAYVEAARGERYGIRITNNTGQRVGIVIAVDGRNVIDGKKAYLRNTERMYILPPYASNTYEGWRTDRDTVNRFYFTDPGDSYSGLFGDVSAMGVIAVGVYREQYVPPPPRAQERDREDGRGETVERGAQREPSGRAAPEASPAGPRAAAPKGAPEARGEAAGTGFGEERYSPSVKVEFRPEARVAERHFVKYEWRETLCKKGIIDCRWPKNRFWDDDDDFAPYPPDRRRGPNER